MKFRTAKPSRRNLAISNACEMLESRTLLSTVTWTNRVTSDNFGIYGANANAARAIVDRALTDWGRVIANFNYAGGGNNYNVNISALNLGGGNRGGTGSIGLTGGKPSSAVIQLDDDGGGANWYFDPTPGTSTTPDDSEFTTLLTRFTANGPNSLGGNDFYRTITHELGHAMGIYLGGSGGVPVVNTGFADPVTPGGTIYKFVAASGTYTFTDVTGLHVYEGPSVGGLPVYPNDLLNAGGTVGFPPATRELITDTDALILRDGEGYTINLPSTINTFLANYSATTKHVVVNEDPNVITDTVTMGINGGNELFSIDGTTEFIANSGIFGIDVATNAGSDTINVQSVDVLSPVTITNTGSTTVNIGGIAGVQGINSPISITNPPSFTAINISNANDTTGRTSILDNDGTTATLSTLAPAVISWAQSDVTNVSITGGTGADNFTIRRTSESITYNGLGGTDTVNIGNVTNGVQSVTGNLTLTNTNSFNTISISDSGNLAARNIVHNTVNISGADYGRITGLSGALIDYKYLDTASMFFRTGNGTDTVSILRTVRPLSIDSAGGGDLVTVGASAASGVQNIIGPVFIDNSPSFSLVTIDDLGDAGARNVTIDESAGYNTVTGLAPAIIRYDSNDISSASVRTGGAADTVQINRSDADLTVTSAGGADTVNVGATAAGGVQSITATLTITNPPNFTTLNINDTGHTAGATTMIDTSAGLTTISGLAPGSIVFDIIDVSVVNITNGSGSDHTSILRNNNPFNFSNDGETDFFAIGNGVNGVRSIFGAINVTNSADFSSISIDNVADVLHRNVTISNTSLTGMAPATISWSTNDLFNLDMQAGSGGNNFTITSLGLFYYTHIYTGTGINSTSVINNAHGYLDVVGQGAYDDFTIQDSGAADTYEIYPTVIDRTNNLLHAFYSSMDAVYMYGGPNGNTFHVRDTQIGSPVFITAGNGFDLVQVDETNPTGPVNLFSSNGNDYVYASLSTNLPSKIILMETMTLGFLGVDNLGVAQVRAGSGAVVRLRGFGENPQGKLDITDNSVLLDYTGSSPLLTTHGAIATGFNGGDWAGFGITSSTAGQNVNATTGVGYAETRDLFGMGPADFALFEGQLVDATTVAIKYTWYGDSDLSGNVDQSADLTLYIIGFNTAGSTWYEGDYDYNFSVDQTGDLTLYIIGFNSQTGTLGGGDDISAGSIFGGAGQDESGEASLFAEIG